MAQVNLVDVMDDGAIFDGSGWDALVVVSTDLDSISQGEISALAKHGASVDKRIGEQTTLLFAPGLAGAV